MDRRFPGLRQRYERTFGERYSARSAGVKRLEALFIDDADQRGYGS